MNKLKPCPFCGEEVKEWDNSNATTVNVIECTNCKVRFVFPCSIILDVTGDDYIQTFNKRGKNGEWIKGQKVYLRIVHCAVLLAMVQIIVAIVVQK